MAQRRHGTRLVFFWRGWRLAAALALAIQAAPVDNLKRPVGAQYRIADIIGLHR
ncbi:hypothetical protein ASAP_0520 [Asaia bogorensis]|uniref:Uncharacterized protein n=1 Tax=Asaia bogorensis TaxID=91915 RepID=A0A060QCD7_9PROT|nr:hypothetical protein ASAP_0520 [Asaia bogorensis]